MFWKRRNVLETPLTFDKCGVGVFLKRILFKNIEFLNIIYVVKTMK
jgi:hypothetical protein